MLAVIIVPNSLIRFLQTKYTAWFLEFLSFEYMIYKIICFYSCIYFQKKKKKRKICSKFKLQILEKNLKIYLVLVCVWCEQFWSKRTYFYWCLLSGSASGRNFQRCSFWVQCQQKFQINIFFAYLVCKTKVNGWVKFGFQKVKI